jgi:Ca-activated chloride channel family protein
MKLSLLISLSLLLCAAQKVCAQLRPADDFFNSGAQFYISNNVPQAKQQVEMGLKHYPEDEKLKKLDELLKQQQQSQSQQNQQQQQQNQQDKSQSQNSKDQKDQQSQAGQDQQKQEQKDQAKKSADQKKEEEKQQAEQQKASPDKKEGEKPEDKNAEGQPVKAGQMTPGEAKHLLDSQKGNEQFLQLKPPEKPQDNQRKIKDW